jgi:hypothetical protein
MEVSGRCTLGSLYPLYPVSEKLTEPFPFREMNPGLAAHSQPLLTELYWFMVWIYTGSRCVFFGCITVIKSMRMRWKQHVACMGEMSYHIKFQSENSECKRLFGRRRYRWEENIKTYLKEVRCGSVDWIHVAIVGFLKISSVPSFVLTYLNDFFMY